MEIGPDGKVYFASTGMGKVLRFTDDGATVSNLETFVDNVDFTIEGVTAKFEWPDNLAFDGDGNLWVLQDGGDNHIWVVGPGHTAINPQVKIFANTPQGSEPTGITFSPDYKYLFLSIQHPNGTNTTPQTDAAGNDVTFDNPTTLVIARTENLGNGAILPVQFVSLKVQTGNQQVAVNWSTSGTGDHPFYIVERSVDGTRFEQIATISANQPIQNNFSYIDHQLPFSAKAYYRIKGCDQNNHCVYSEVKMAKLTNNASLFTLYPQPVRDFVQVKFTNATTLKAAINIYSSDGKLVYKSMQNVVSPGGLLTIPTKNLGKGTLYTERSIWWHNCFAAVCKVMRGVRLRSPTGVWCLSVVL